MLQTREGERERGREEERKKPAVFSLPLSLSPSLPL